MNAVWNSYGQLCGCPEIFKKSCKFFCRELDIRVPQIMKADFTEPVFFKDQRKMLCNIARLHKLSNAVDVHVLRIFLQYALPQSIRFCSCSAFSLCRSCSNGSTNGSVR